MKQLARKIASSLHAFRLSQDGATAIEYTLIASLIGGAVALTVFSLGGSVLTELYQKLAAAMGIGGGP